MRGGGGAGATTLDSGLTSDPSCLRSESVILVCRARAQQRERSMQHAHEEAQEVENASRDEQHSSAQEKEASGMQSASSDQREQRETARGLRGGERRRRPERAVPRGVEKRSARALSRSPSLRRSSETVTVTLYIPMSATKTLDVARTSSSSSSSRTSTSSRAPRLSPQRLRSSAAQQCMWMVYACRTLERWRRSPPGARRGGQRRLARLETEGHDGWAARGEMRRGQLAVDDREGQGRRSRGAHLRTKG